MKRKTIIVLCAVLLVSALAWAGFRTTRFESESTPYGRVTLHRSFGRITTVTVDGDRDGEDDWMARYVWSRAPWSHGGLVTGAVAIKTPDEVWELIDEDKRNEDRQQDESTVSADAAAER